MSRPFIAARIESRISRVINAILRRAGWKERVVAYTGYGDPEFVRVLARLVLLPDRSSAGVMGRELLRRRGWRNFFSAPVGGGTIRIHTSNGDIDLPTDRSGYIDERVPNSGLEPGWNEIILSTMGGRDTRAQVHIVAPDQEFGIVSDIDDTIITTMLPRLLLAFWNSFVIHENARQDVPGMAEMYHELLGRHPGAPLIFVSTGAWNTQATLTRFLHDRGFPLGAMLLTDWGPTNTGWFRSGQEHKARELRRLARDFPRIKWLLVGDDGQHDPTIYSTFAREAGEHVRMVAIRELSSTEQILAHGTTEPLEEGRETRRHPAPWVAAADGWSLLPKVRRLLERTAGGPAGASIPSSSARRRPASGPARAAGDTPSMA